MNTATEPKARLVRAAGATVWHIPIQQRFESGYVATACDREILMAENAPAEQVVPRYVCGFCKKATRPNT